MRILHFLLFIILTSSFTSCLESRFEEPDFFIDGMKPVYAIDDTWKIIKSEGPREVQNLGRIYIKDHLLFLVDNSLGVHVIDNTDPDYPISLFFIVIPGCMDISIKNQILYADNYRDLVSIDISDLNNVSVVERLTDFYAQGQTYFPENYSGYFECVDDHAGIVLGWEFAELMNPKCNVN